MGFPGIKKLEEMNILFFPYEMYAFLQVIYFVKKQSLTLH